MRAGLILALLILSGCGKFEAQKKTEEDFGLAAGRLMAQCKLDAVNAGAAFNHDVDMADPGYLVTCMQAKGYILIPGPTSPCAQPPYRLDKGICYRRGVPISN